MTLDNSLGRGGTGWHGDAAVRTRTTLKAARTLANELRTDHNALMAKLDADATAPGSAFVADATIAASAIVAVKDSLGQGGSLLHGDDGTATRTLLSTLRTIANELKTDQNIARTKLGGAYAVAPAAATLLRNPAGAHNAVLFTARATGTAANSYTITYALPADTNEVKPLVLSVVGNAITVTLAVAADGSTVTTTALDLVNAVTTSTHPSFSGPVAALVTAALDNTDAGNNGSGLLTALGSATMAGGLVGTTVSAATVAVGNTAIMQGGSGLHADMGSALTKQLISIATLLNQVKARHNTMLTDLDADGTVTDTNYVALHAIAAADVV